MRNRRSSLSRRLGLVLSLCAVVALAITSATAARVDSDSPGSASTVALMQNDKVTICHAAGLAGTTKFVTLTISVNAVYGNGGHFYENGTPQAGHEQDYFGPCITPPSDDVCPNLEGSQSEIPDGMVKDEQGNCVTHPSDDVCPNLEGDQHSIPDGMVKDEHGNCVTPPPSDDVCPNLEGDQHSIPDGMVKDEHGNCVTPPEDDVCPNIEGNQHEIPAGMVKDEQGNCVTHPGENTVTAGVTFTEATCTAGPSFQLVKTNPGLRFYDVEGPLVDGKPVAGGTYTFTALPDEGYTVVGQSVWVHTFAAAPTNCGTPPPPPPPPSDEHMDVQVIKDATAQAQLVNGQADIAYTVRVRNNGPNQAHNVVLKDASPSGVTFLAVTQQPVGGSCTISTALLDCTLGTLGPGVERVIGFSARVSQTGTYVNSATGTGDGKDTNGANNTDDATTLVTAPVTPPTAKPTPKPQPKPKPTPTAAAAAEAQAGALPRPQGDARHGEGEREQPPRDRQGDQVADTGEGCRGAVHRHRPRQGRQDERQGCRPCRDHPQQGGGHAREDHEREGVQQRQDRRGRRLRAAGDGLGIPRAGTRSVPRVSARGTDASGRGLAGPQGPVGPCVCRLAGPRPRWGRKPLDRGAAPRQRGDTVRRRKDQSAHTPPPAWLRQRGGAAEREPTMGDGLGNASNAGMGVSHAFGSPVTG